MRVAAFQVITLTALAACSMAETLPATHIVPGQPFSLKPGQVAAAQDGRLRVGFDAVSSDSRCPKGEQCVWAGDATVRVWVESQGGARRTGELHTAPNLTRALAVSGQELLLVKLEPYPIRGKPIAPGDYVSTFTLAAAGSGAAADR
jgi:hypothetical protein